MVSKKKTICFTKDLKYKKKNNENSCVSYRFYHFVGLKISC